MVSILGSKDTGGFTIIELMLVEQTVHCFNLRALFTIRGLLGVHGPADDEQVGALL